MLEEEDQKPLLTTPGQTLSLTEAGKRILSESKTVQIKPATESSIAPKVIRINGATAQGVTGGTQPRVIRLSSSQLNNLKMGNLNGKNFFGSEICEHINQYFKFLKTSCN